MAIIRQNETENNQKKSHLNNQIQIQINIRKLQYFKKYFKDFSVWN